MNRIDSTEADEFSEVCRQYQRLGVDLAEKQLERRRCGTKVGRWSKCKAEYQVDVGPAVLASSRNRAGCGRRSDAVLVPRLDDESFAYLLAPSGCKHVARRRYLYRQASLSDSLIMRLD